MAVIGHHTIATNQQNVLNSWQNHLEKLEKKKKTSGATLFTLPYNLGLQCQKTILCKLNRPFIPQNAF